ncbi:hypothetical protein FACS1894159_05880 [Bacteroidia bacterium]|nr:hypothetical protein FACS1894159_05880 [Bacteroidia bacterium]
MKIAVILSALCLAVGLTSCGNERKTENFVRVEEGRFYIGDRQYGYIGTNFWYGAILGSKGEGGDRRRLIRELDLMKSIGIDNLRILVGSDGVEGVVSKVEPTLQRAPGVYNDQILDGLDYLLMEMGRRRMYAVLYLNNSWEWSGGYSQYLQWAGAGKAPIPAVDGWNAYTEHVRQYAKNEKAHSLFADHVDFIVSRTNRYTGRKYTDDTAIMAWQIGNEPRAFGDENKEAYAEWMAATAEQIKRLDPNHLVSTGSEGKAGSEGDIALWERVHADRNIDYMTIHIWPNNWGWIHRETMEADLPQAIINTKGYIDEHAALAARLKKPLVMEEFGYPRDGFSFKKESATLQRNAYYEAVFSYIHENMQHGGVFAGCNFWGWGGYAMLSDDHYVWRKGDDYTGDPAQEEQGLNSVFASDVATITLIGKYSTLLNMPSGGRTSQTALLLKNLRAVAARGTMFGHQDDTAYGVGWFGDAERSDVKSVCGDYPAVIGFDMGHIELGVEVNLDGVPFDKIRSEIIAQHRRKGMSTVSWHPDNPLTCGDAWDVSDKTVVASVLPGGSCHEIFTGWLDTLAAFFNSLIDDNGDKIPILFRPWHENTDSWFWWGADLCSVEQYRQLWEMTWDRLHLKGATNLLYAYSPSSNVLFSQTYNERYPGDHCVDLLGFDTYHFGQAGQFRKGLEQNLAQLTRLGKEHDKPIAITETGLEGVTMADWWTAVLQPAMQSYPVAYVLVWRNAYDRPGHFYAPYPGQASVADFVQYYNGPQTLFCSEVDLYK